MNKWVYFFDEGNASMRNLLGGKGANLAEMTGLGLPIPQGFTVTTQACNDYYAQGEEISKEVLDQIYSSLERLEKVTGKKFGDTKNPLLVSVRSGARVSMPGMMDTILNLGLNDESLKGFIEKTQNERFVYDSYRRFIQMFSDVVMEIDKALFEHILDDQKAFKRAKSDTELTSQDLQEIIVKYKNLYEDKIGEPFPQDPKVQLLSAIKAVFRSWNNPRAIYYRRMNYIPSDWGTAVNVQSMVFGNMGDTSGTGVAFTRNPATGEKHIYGEYLINAQGEDVVAGVRTPRSIECLKEDMPNVYKQFVEIATTLENHYKDMQDMEFTIEEGKLYFLQTRNGKRTAQAALEIACDLVDNNVITKEEAIVRIEANTLDQLLHPSFEEESIKRVNPIGKGLPASPGAATGRVYFTAKSAKLAKELGNKVILVRQETSPDDIEGMHVSEGILTVRGGMTSHAAVVARGMGTACVSGCSDIKINELEKKFTLGNITIHEGDYISLDGSTGKIYNGRLETKKTSISGNFKRVMQWADEIRRLKIKANADTPIDAKHAIEFGAEGIGLCRTEHMFFEPSRIPVICTMILAKTKEKRQEALSKLIEFQRADFIEIFKAVEGKGVTVRFLDPPLHEFLPTSNAEIDTLANIMHETRVEIAARIAELREFNPMMGHRGCRLDISYPEIAIMQARAIAEAAIIVNRETNCVTKPEIMIPLVGNASELKFVKNLVVETIDKVCQENNDKLEYEVGTMIEIPRAALQADKIANEADFFSFGTNDLTQMTFAFSRDDAAKFLDNYYKNGIYDFDPFQHIDVDGVGQLVQMAVERGRKTKPNLSMGVCGEHGGDPNSIEFFDSVGLDYVSCSAFRVPIARLAAAQATIKNNNKQYK